MAKIDPQILAHLEWIGFVRPTGLVVSAPALVRAGAILDRRDAEGQRVLRACLEEHVFDPKEGLVPYLPDFRSFAESVLGWNFSPKGYAGTVESPIPPELEVPLPDYGETLRTDFAVRELEPKDGASSWQLLVRVLEPGEDFDKAVRGNSQLEASAHGRMERLLRQTGVSAGLLFNGRVLRLLSAPRGESSGWLDFRVADMIQSAGRPISTALRLLLGQTRLLSLPQSQRLSALLEDSRKFQNEVSERLAEQVLHALYELLRGFQAAHDASGGELLRKPLADQPDEVYRALLIVILRLVFLLYAEERDMLPEDETFLRYYSVAGLYERLREDAALFPDTMDQRYGAWAQFVVLFRMVHDGAESGAMRLPKRHGVLFDPDRYKFLEGRVSGRECQTVERIESPLVPDGTIYRALENLLVLDGERISYRALDVEQIGSVYETMMGFRLETATGQSVAIRAQKKHGAPITIDLDALLDEPAGKRAKWFQDHSDRKLTDKVKKATVEATTIEDVHSALFPVIDLAATPDLVPMGAMVLQPSEERRRSGSHYTPRELTEPMVRKTLEPILRNLRGSDDQIPTPEQILDLKVCDPTMGSGAFLVESCRQLGDALLEAWHAHGEEHDIPSDEDEVVYARRLIAQRCLYGVDKNPVAVDLAKVSLWLVTLAKDHALTFVDHALRHGDSLIGLSLKQIEAFHWDPDARRFQAGFETMQVREHLTKVTEWRERIRNADESVSDHELRTFWNGAQNELDKVRLFGDLVLAAFFEGDKPKEREEKRRGYASVVISGEAERYRCRINGHSDQELSPFHWQIEFPEVFERADPGFAAIVGNPPFMGGQFISGALSSAYLDFIKLQHIGTLRVTDLVAYFFRRAYELIRPAGAFGLIATNTIAQGDTRVGGLGEIRKRGGTIYSATRRFSWPGNAAVVVSLIHVGKEQPHPSFFLDSKPVSNITSYLYDRGGDKPPQNLLFNKAHSHHGSYIYGAGFTFDNTDPKATPLTIATNIIDEEPAYRQRILPYLRGQDILSDPAHEPHRLVINLNDLTEEEAREKWPRLYSIVEQKVRPERMSLKDNVDGKRYKANWWRWARHSSELDTAKAALERVLVHPFTSSHLAFVFANPDIVVGSPHNVFTLSSDCAFSILQSRIHEVWVRFFASTLKDDLRYTRSDCFENFPFPEHWESQSSVEAAGKTYYEFRDELMIRNNEGLTKTYNRFHHPEERNPEIENLRKLHAAMDRAVLDAYGFSDILINSKFLLDYEIDEEAWGKKKKPYRYRWPDVIRDEVLARLLELNAERAKAEVGYAASSLKKSRRNAAAKRATKDSETGNLFK